MLSSGDFPSLLEPWFPTNLTFSQVRSTLLRSRTGVVRACLYHWAARAVLYFLQQDRDEQALIFIGGAHSGATAKVHPNRSPEY